MIPMSIVHYYALIPIFGQKLPKIWPKNEQKIDANQKSAFIGSPLGFFAS